MIIHNFLKTQLHKEQIHEGEGLCPHAMIFSGEEIDAPVQFINYTIIPPGASFGLHGHGSDNEFYIVLNGSGIYTENGKETEVAAGDIIMNAVRGTHGIRNTGSQDMQLLVFEVQVAEKGNEVTLAD